VTEGRVLVAGIGNIFLGDDGFGVEVVQRLLSRRDLPAGVDVVDYGIRGYDLAFAMLGDHAATVLVDALPRGEPPGTVMVIEPTLSDDLPDPATMPDHGQGAFQGHAMTPGAVFQLVRTLGGEPGRVLVVGCEPESFGDEQLGRMGLSDTVARAVPLAVETLLDVVRDLLSAPAAAGSRHA
jgi:hydrogenase maturation protease